jgi:hypothetical protein
MSKIQLIKTQVMDVFSSLSQRDRFLVIFLTATFFFGGIGAAIYSMTTSLKTRDIELETLETNIQLLQIIQTERETVQAKVVEIEQALAENATTDLSAFLEKAATEAGFNPKEKSMQVREKSTVTDENLQEKIFSVSLTKLSTEEFSRFLLKTETSGYPLQIQKSTIKRKKRGDEITLNINLDIAAYKMLEEEG